MFTFFVYLSNFVGILVQAMVVAIILRAIFGWFDPMSSSGVTRFLRDITEPVLAPLRRFVPTVGMLDLTPMVAIILIQYVIGPAMLVAVDSIARLVVR